MPSAVSMRAAFVVVMVVGVSPAFAADPVTLSGAKVSVGDGLKPGQKYVQLTVDALVNKKPGKGEELSGKAVCQVGEKKMSDKARAMTLWKDVDEGETKRVELRAFVTEPLDAAPTSCEFTVKWGKTLGGDPKEVAKYCWTGDAVKDGPCAKAK